MNLINTLYGSPYRGHITVVALLLFLLFTFVLFQRVTSKYQTEGEKFLRLQRACTPDDFKQTLSDWSTKNADAPKIYKRDNLIKLDLAYPLIYAGFFAFAYAWARGGAKPASRWDYLFFVIPFCAALFDYFENGLHFHLLRGVNTAQDIKDAIFPSALVLISSIFSHVKIALFCVGALAYPCALIARLFK